jgi:glycerate dehydrogenase
MMKFVIVDGHTLNPGDLNWKELADLTDCEIHERSSPSELLNRVQHAEGILTNKVVLDRALIGKCPNLKYIGVTATGYNIVDVVAARERGVAVTNTPGYGAPSVAQMVFALILELTHHVGYHSETVRGGRWTASPDFCYWDYPLVELEGLTLGIVGLGSIGRKVARIAQGFGMRVITVRRESTAESGVEAVSLEDLLRQGDVVTLHCPLTKETGGMMNADRLGLMKPTAFLINTSRGGLINENDLAKALEEGSIAGAGLDVLSVEPPPATNPLLRARNCIITPHIAWATHAARTRLLQIAIGNVKAFLNGTPCNVVN